MFECLGCTWTTDDWPGVGVGSSAGGVLLGLSVIGLP
jgi:hypothetical protein